MSLSPLIAVDETRMFQEAGAVSEGVRAQLQEDTNAIAAIGAELGRLAPRSLITCARGRSSHAATFAKYSVETKIRSSDRLCGALRLRTVSGDPRSAGLTIPGDLAG